VVIKTERSDKTEIKKFFLKISGHQQRWSRPLPGAILILPALLVVADLELAIAMKICHRVKTFFPKSGIFFKGMSIVKPINQLNCVY